MSMSPSSRFRERLLWTRVVFACAAAICVLSCNTVQADVTQSSEIVKEIVDDWNRRQQIRGFRYLVAGTVVVPKGWLNHLHPPDSLSMDVPPDDRVNEWKTEYFLDLESYRSRIERDYTIYNLDRSRFVRDFRVDLFDGQRIQRIHPRNRNEDTFDVPGGEWRTDIEFELSSEPELWRGDTPVLLAHGMVRVPVAEGGSILSPAGSLRRTLTPEMFTEYGRAVRDGQECVVLRSLTDHTGPNPAFNEYWVDVEKDSTILRCVRYIGDVEIFQLDLWYEEEDSRNHALARYTLMESPFDESEGGLVQISEMLVLEYDREPVLADSLFYVEPQPGDNVHDWTKDRVYRVGLPGEPDRDIAELRMELELTRSPRNRTRLLLLSFSSLAGLFMLGILLVARHRKKRKKGDA